MNTFLSDNVSSSDFERLLEFDTMESDNFCELAKFLDLNPATDFQHADLSRVDFSNCDLSMFVFKGSDLTGSFGVNIQMPPPKNLEGALLNNSVFLGFFSSERYLDCNPKIRADLARRSTSDALELSQWVLDLSVNKGRSKEELSAVTTKLFSETKFHSVKNSILYGSLHILGKEDFKKFLFHLFATEMDDEKTIQITLQMLSRIFPNDDDAINYPISIIRSEHRLALLDLAISSVAKRNHNSRLKELVRENIVSDKRREYRQYIIKKCIGSSTDSDWPLLYHLAYSPFTSDIGSVKFLDFARTISNEISLDLAKRAARREMIREENLKSKSEESLDFERIYNELLEGDPTKEMIHRGVGLIKEAFRNFYRHSGIKFTFDDEALRLLSPSGRVFKKSGDLYDRVPKGKKNQEKWASVSAFL
jgi:Pentapeptide repeats (8 copies)